MRTFVRSLILLCLALPAFAQAPKKPSDIPVESFFRRAEYSQLQLSPNGKLLAALVPIRGRNNLAVIDIESKSRTVITELSNLDVFTFWWVNNGRLCFRVADGQEVTGRIVNRGTFCTDRDGGNVRDFTRISGLSAARSISPLARTYDESGEMIVQARLRSEDSLDVYRFNTRTGRYEILSEDSPGDVRRWVLDWNNLPRVAVSQPSRQIHGTTRSVWYRDDASGKWEKIFETGMTGSHGSKGEMTPLAFDGDNATLYVSYRSPDRDRAAIYKYDTKARKLGEVMFQHPLIDLEGGLVFDRSEKRLLGIRYDADVPSVAWIDEDMARVQKSIDAAMPKTVNGIFLAADAPDRALVFAQSDRDPGVYYLFDRKAKRMEELVHTRSWIDPSLMAERRFIRYKARDGMEIPAWITVPQGGQKNLPLVVNIHGGPWVRAYSGIEWGRWPDAQFFASRGYAVLEPEPRGSLGFGDKHYASSFRQWGQSMQDDITDGALYLAKEGLVDKSRMCVFGGSYGGYASAMALAKDPDLWACGVPFVAVTDLTTFQKATYSDMSYATDFFQTEFRKMVGDADADKAMFEKYSPARHADAVKAPVLIAMGSDDVRVPQVHGDDYVSALRSAGKKVEYVIYNGEGHGFNKDENVFDFYKRVEKFFAENLKKNPT
ncbi:MAG TPA: S9 family peptidase [Usitatibacter sp.]|jgi:dipeptidyl aminopeptidase/acylaminoacyl peptidase|nr:S9 family peptidase [Usitatibacter sp.]